MQRRPTLTVLYLTQVTFCPPHLGATMGLDTSWLLAKVTRFRLPSVHPVAVVHSKAGDVPLQGEALHDLALGDVVQYK